MLFSSLRVVQNTMQLAACDIEYDVVRSIWCEYVGVRDIGKLTMEMPRNTRSCYDSRQIVVEMHNTL